MAFAPLILTHVVAGSVGLLSGAVALYAAKGETLHRRSGLVFVVSMLGMSLAGATIATVRQQEANVIAGLLTAYLVATALITVRPVAAGRRLDIGLMLGAFVLAVTSLSLGFFAIFDGNGTIDGIPAPMVLIFGSVALLGSVSDLRRLQSVGLRGAKRLARHLWRMCFALWIATASFFLGQADMIPEPLRVGPLLGIVAFLPLFFKFYWLWRVRAGDGPPRRPRAPVHEPTGVLVHARAPD
jgi:uncharacterized membrane protein